MTLVDLVVKNGKIVAPWGITPGGVAIDDGKIVAVAAEANLPKGDQNVDAKGNYILPGLIDPHTHPGAYRSFKDDIRTETPSAAAGGITTWLGICKSPRIGRTYKKALTPKDVVSYKEVFPESKEVLDENLMIDFAFTWAVQSDQHASEIPEYAEKFGVTSYKFYIGYKKADKWTASIGLPTSIDDGTIYLAFENIGRIGPPGIALIHAENMEVARIFKERVMKEGRKDLAAWDDRSPHWIEAEHIREYAYFAKIAGCTLYPVHVSTGEGLEEVAKAKADGVNIIAETVHHYLVLTKFDDPPAEYGKVNPPLRDKETIERLWQGIKTGLIECLGSDHVTSPKEGHTVEGDIWASKAGFSGTETMLPVMLTEGVEKKRIPLEKVVEICCQNNAKAFGLYPKKGVLSVGSDGDLVIVDMDKKVKVSPEVLHSSSNFTVWEGRELKGWPIFTVVRGNVVFDHGEIVGKPGVGEYIPRIPGRQLYPLE